jgi:hypothetical protein
MHGFEKNNRETQIQLTKTIAIFAKVVVNYFQNLFDFIKYYTGKIL